MSSPRDQVRKRLDAFRSQQLLRAVQAALYEAADLVRSEAFRSISAGSVSGKKHKPSAPGQPPNRDTGVLQAHIRAELVSPLEARVTSEAPYADALENGSSRKAGTGRGSFPTRKDGSSKFGPIKREFGKVRPLLAPTCDRRAMRRPPKSSACSRPKSTSW